VNEILKLAGDTFSVMETLTPQDFMSFRDKLTPASGFQSFQMREMELLLGVHWPTRIKYGKVDPLDHIRKLAKDSPAGGLALSRLENVLKEQSLKDAMRSWAYRTPIFGSQPHHEGDSEVVEHFIQVYSESVREHHNSQYERLVASSVGKADELRKRYDGIIAVVLLFINVEDIEDSEQKSYVKRYRAGIIFIESYRELPLLAWPRLLIDSLIAVDSQMVQFRHRHARAVERIIGRRVGTGGSSGVNYLDETTKIRVFHDLWTARTVLLPKSRRPNLENADYYQFGIQ
jgi:tryptophan 2,3-dioxygenase